MASECSDSNNPSSSSLIINIDHDEIINVDDDENKNVDDGEIINVDDGENKNVDDDEIQNVDDDEITNVDKDENKNVDDNKECRKSYEVCVSRVPRSLRISNPGAYRPHFVGLGPYHGFQYQLTMTNELKSEAAERLLDKPNYADISKCLKSCASHFYHVGVDVDFNDEHGHPVLALDAFYLLGLLHAHALGPEERALFLTGKPGMPLINDAGVELTMDAIIGDVFMLENQIPTHLLHQINRSINKPLDLGAKMLAFCQNHCLMVNPLEVSDGKPEDRDHLLHLMYHLTAPPKPPEDKNPDAEKEAKEKAEKEAKKKAEKEAKEKAEKEAKEKAEKEAKEKAEKEAGTTGTAANPNARTNFTWPTESIVGSIFLSIFIFFFILVMVVTFFASLVWSLLKWVLSKLGDLLNVALDQLKKLPDYIPADGTSSNAIAQHKMFKPLAENFDQFNAAILNLSKKGRAGPVVTIRSVTEFKGAGVQFVPVNGISDIKYEEDKCQFLLPIIKLDANSEVIMRNLVAYEALTSPDYLVFARYVEIMRAIVDTAEDVKVLVDQEIIVQTKLSNQAVADLFNGMSKSIKPTNTPLLDAEIKKLNAKYDESQWLQKAMTKYVYPSWQLMTVLATFIFLVLTAVQTYCSVYTCSSSRSSTLVYLPRDWDYYGINNDFVSSM